MLKFNRTFVVLLMLTFVCPSALSQQPIAPPQDRQEAVRIATTAVDIDVVVTDKTGRRITGLTAADFQVLDNEQPQTIDFFKAIEGSCVARRNMSAASAGGATTEGPITPLVSPFSGRFVALRNHQRTGPSGACSRSV